MMSTKLTCSALSLLLVVANGSSQAGVDCSKEGVAHYLKQGVSVEQVFKLCGKESDEGARRQQMGSRMTSVPASEAELKKKNDLLFFNSMIVADTVELNDDQLIYIKKDCLKYGEEVEEDVPEYACGQFQTSVKLTGLEIEQAITGIPFVRDTELIVSGDIQREILDFNRLDSDTQKVLNKIFNFAPDTISLPLRKDADPKNVGKRLKALGKNSGSSMR